MSVLQKGSDLDKHALVISLAPFRFGTRARKAALAFRVAEAAQVSYVAPARIGRTGQWDKPGTWEVDGVRVCQVECAEPLTEPTFRTQIRNLFRSYAPALFRIMIRVVRTRADLIYVNGPTLIAAGLLHKLVYRSTMVLDIPERPGVLSAKGSLASIVGRADKLILRLVAPFAALTTVVTYADVTSVQNLGHRNVKLVRNVPLKNWAVDYRDPPSAAKNSESPFEVLVMGSIFEGRGYEMLIEAIAMVSKRFPVRLTICGPARDSYRSRLTSLAAQLGVESMVLFVPPVASESVSAAYRAADVGMVLYESNDLGNDGLSNKLFECVTSGRPVIASDLPENRRFIESAGVGWLAETSVGGIARALSQAHASASLVQLSRHCRAIGESELNWESEFECVIRLLDNEIKIRG